MIVWNNSARCKYDLLSHFQKGGRMKRVVSLENFNLFYRGDLKNGC